MRLRRRKPPRPTLAELEIRSRQMERGLGLFDEGVGDDRPSRQHPRLEQYQAMTAAGRTVREIADEMGVAMNYVYRLREHHRKLSDRAPRAQMNWRPPNGA